MRVATRWMLVAAVGLSGCVSSISSSEPRGTTYARHKGEVLVVFTNASPDRMCGLYMTEDGDTDYGDNWLPEAGVPSGGSVQFRVKPGKYKARWDTCREGQARPYYAATLWRESAVAVKRETQLYAYVADSVAPTKRAQVLGRDYNIVRFPGQPIDPIPQAQPQRPRPQQVALRAAQPAADVPQIAGFIGRVPLSAEIVAQRESAQEIAQFNAREFVDPTIKIDPAKAAAAKDAKAKDAKAKDAKAKDAKAKDAKARLPAGARPSLDRKHELADSTIEYRKK